MTKASVLRNITVALLSWAFLQSTTGFASIVYDNSTSDLNRSYFAGNGVEFGDEIFLQGADRTITEFRFETYLSSGPSGNEIGQLFLRLNDGPSEGGSGRNTPGTVFYQSPTFKLGTLRQTVIVSGLSVTVPGNADHFTWSVVINGIDTGEQTGLLLYDNPTIGSSYADFWKNDGGQWNTFLVDGGATQANFAAQIRAVPEPSTLAMGVAGALVVLGGLSWRRRSA